ncbi:hypothetical protein lerEdw1_004834 [Lerista edwardsae]|nr:hypothetical protein lerEdw1_004834 [Lerista edwardsae]
MCAPASQLHPGHSETQEPYPSVFASPDNLDSLPSWRQELLQSESKWLQERIWRSTYLSTSRKPSSSLDLFWEPLTQAVITSLLSSIADPSGRQKVRNELSMFGSADGPRGPQSHPTNVEELASHISDGIMCILRDRNILQETTTRKRFSGRKVKSVHVPPLCLADFDDVYQPLVKEVDNLLSLEFGGRCRPGSRGKTGGPLAPHQQVIPRPISGASRGDCRGPGDLKGMTCLSMMGPLAQKSQRLSCVATNLDHFIRSLKTSESKHLVNKVLRIILDSLWPNQSQGGFVGPFADTASRNVMSYQDTDLPQKRPLVPSSACPHAYRLGNSIFGSNLGLSPKSVVLLDVVSEKLIRTLLDKCIMTEQFTGTFAFDEFPEDEQICDIRKSLSDDEFFEPPGREEKVPKVDSCSSVFSYNIKYAEEPEEEVQAAPCSYESALDVLAHTLVKPVMTELSLSIEHPGHLKTYSKKSVGFTHASSRKPHGSSFSRRHAARYGKGESYSSLPRSRKPEPLVPVSGRRPNRKGTRGRDRTVLETAVQHRTFGGRTGLAPAARSLGGRSFSSTTSTGKRSYHREVLVVTGHGDQPGFSTIYSAALLEEVISQLLIKIFSSLRTKYDRDACIDLNEMNRLFVSALVGELNRAGVGVLQRAEEKAHLPRVDGHAVQRIVDSILQEFGFQLAADRAVGRDIDTLAAHAAEVILMEMLDYQLPPPLCRRLPQSAIKPVKAERIIHRIEGCIHFPAMQRKRQPPPTYITVLSQKYLERVINRLVAQIFPPCDSDSIILAPEQDKEEPCEVNPDELCSYLIKEVMKSISKHKIWVARKDDQCRLHSEKETQRMVDSVYKNMLKKSGSQLAMQKDVKNRKNTFVDSMTSFIIQEITRHHLQTFLSKEELPSGTPDPDTLSENIVRTVLNSISETSASSPGVFPTKFLEEMVSRVLSKILSTPDKKASVGKGQQEDELSKVVKKLASSINLQFGKTTPPPGSHKGEEQSLGAPLTAVMDDVVDSVCNKISSEREVVPEENFGSPTDNAVFESVKRLIGKGISDYLLHPLFSGDVPRASPSSLSEGIPEHARDELQEVQEENENESPFNTFLSSGFLKDIISGLLSKIFPSSPPRGEAAAPWDAKKPPSDSDLSKLSSQLLDDVRMKLLKHEIRVTKEAPQEQYEYSDEDVQNMTDSLCSKIIQKSGSLEAVQREVRKKSNSLIDRIAGFLVGDLLQKHVQPFVSGQELPTWDRAAAGDSMSGLEVSRTSIKPLDLRQATHETRRSPSPTPSFGKIIRELFSNISQRFSDVPLGPSRDNLGDTAFRVAKSVANVLSRTRLSVQESPVEELGSSPDVRGPSSWKLPDKVMSGLLSEDGMDSSSCHMTTMTFEEPADRPLHAARSPDLAEAKCLIQKRLMIGPAGPLARAPVPYTTVLSYPVLEAIVDRLLVRIFPGAKDGPFEPDLCERLAQLRKAIMEAVLKQAIWISAYGSESGIPEEAMERMVESVYCDVLHEVLLQQPLQGDKESLSNLYVTKIACFIVNEMFKYHLGSEEGTRPAAAFARDLPASCVTVFPCRLLEAMLSQLLMKIFPDPQRIAADSGSLADFSESDFMEMAMNLKSYVITEISAHEIKLENISRRVPDMDQETEEDIAGSVYNQILEKSASQNELQESLTHQGNATVYQLANLLIREILNFHLHPFLSGSDTSSGEATPLQQEHQPFSHRIYSAVFLEDVVVAFFCKMLSSPDILAYSKDCKMSEGEMRDLVIELVNALVCEFKALQVKVIQSEEENLPFPQVIAEDVVQITDSIYEKLAQDLGSEVAIFKAFQNNGFLLAEKLAPLIVNRVSEYQFQPLFTGDTSSYLFSFLDAETIVDRVETILPETTTSASSSGMFREMFSKILQRIFPAWSPQRSSEEMEATVGDTGSRGSPMELMEEGPTSEADRTIQNLMENICKTICPKSGSPRRKYGSGTAEESANFTGRPRADRHTLESPSPPGQTLPPPRLSPQPAGWTVHRVKLGDAEPQPSQAEDKGNVYSSTFLKDLFSGLVSKLLSSTASVCLLDKKESEAEPPVQTLVESILKAFAKSPVKVLRMPKGGQTSPPVGQKEMAKIIHASLCGILQDRGGGTPICTDKDSDFALAEKLASSIKKEILGYQIQGSAAKSPQTSASKPFEFGEMARRVLSEVRRTNTQSQMKVPCPLLVSQRFIHDVLDALLTNILPLPDKATDNSEDQFAEFDFIHMKLLSKVMAEIGKDKNTKVQYLERCQPHPKASQTVANSVYGNLVPEFGDVSGLEKCIKAGCTILFERIADCVIKEISGDQIQTYFSEELNRQQEAEAERSLADDYSATAEPPEGQAILHSHLRGLSSIVIEEVAAKLLSKMFHAIPLDDIESSSISAMKEVAKKILDSMQGLISKKKLRVWQQGDMEDLGLEDSRAVGEVVDSVYTDIIKHSGSETSLYDELTNENEDFVKRVACVMVSEISRHDFQPFPEEEEEEELPRPSAAIKLETDKIIRKFLSDMELEKAKKEQPAAQTPIVPVLFMEEILSRFLTKVVLAQQELGPDMDKSWSRTEVNNMADQLKVSVEREMSKNKISLVAPEIREEKLAPEDEAKVDKVVHSVFSNVLEISGSHQEMFKDVTTTKVIFPEQVASIIINEVSSCNIKNPFAENIENETLSALELDRIVSKVIAQVGSHAEPDDDDEEDVSLSEVSALPFPPEDAPLLPDTEDVPVKIVPYVGHKALKIDPDIISDHLAVLSIKTEPLEKLERACLSKVGMSLMELRRASASGKNLPVDMGGHDPHKKKERRPSLDMAGRLDVKPREAVCRNSFQSLMKPDITKVELLRDVESKQDLIVRLVAHDISDPFHRGMQHLDDLEGEERVLREDRSVFFEAPFMPPPQEEDKDPEPPSEPLLPKTSSSIIRKRSLSLSKCCPALTASASGLIFKGKPNAPPLPQIEITPMSRVPSIKDTAASTPVLDLSPPVSVTTQYVQTSWTEVPPALPDKSEEAEKTLEEAVVDMHLTRDTETMSGAFEITSVYQDKKVKDPSGDSTDDEESESGKGIKSTSSEEAVVPVQQRSSVLEKVSSALSRVFSRTAASNPTKSAPAPD